MSKKWKKGKTEKPVMNSPAPPQPDPPPQVLPPATPQVVPSAPLAADPPATTQQITLSTPWTPTSAWQWVMNQQFSLGLGLIWTVFILLITAIATSYITLYLAKDWFEKKIDTTIDAKISVPLKELDAKAKEHEKEIALLKRCLEVSNEMSAEACKLNYDTVVVLYYDFILDTPIEKVPESFRLSIFQSLNAALTHRNRFDLIQEPETKRIDDLLMKHSRKLCPQAFTNLGYSYLALKNPDKAGSFFLTSLTTAERNRIPSDDSTVFNYTGLLLCNLIQPKHKTMDERIAGAMFVLNDCQAITPVPYIEIYDHLVDSSDRGIAKYLRQLYQKPFDDSLQGLTKRIYEDRKKVQYIYYDDDLYIVGEYLSQGKKERIMQFIKRTPGREEIEKRQRPKLPARAGGC